MEVANLVLDIELYKVAGAEVNIVVGMVADMVATKVFLNQNFFRQKCFAYPIMRIFYALQVCLYFVFWLSRQSLQTAQKVTMIG